MAVKKKVTIVLVIISIVAISTMIMFSTYKSSEACRKANAAIQWDCSVTCAEESTPDSYVITYSDAKILSKTGVLTVQNRTRIWQYSCGWLLFFSERYRWRTHGRYSCWCWWKYGYKSICIWRKRHRIIYKIIDKTKNIEKNIRRYFGIWSSGMDNGFRSIRNSLIWFGWSGTNTENIPQPIKKAAFPYIYTP